MNEPKDIWHLKEKNERIVLVNSLEENSFEIWLARNSNPNTLLLYKEAKHCFLDECYVAATITFFLAIEQFLLWKNQGRNILATINYPDSKKILNEAEVNHLITIELKQDLIEFREGCRDQIMHPKRCDHMYLVGLAKDKNKDYFGKEGYKSVFLGPLACAERGINLFFQVINYNRKK